MAERSVRSRLNTGERHVGRSSTSTTHPLVCKLESISILAAGERDALANLPMQVMDLRADQDIVRRGDRPTRS